jgi:hypothetical protein
VDRDETRVRVVSCASIKTTNRSADRWFCTGSKEGASFFDQGPSDRHNLFRRFSLAEYDFGESLPQRPMVVQRGKTKIFVRERAQAVKPLFDGQLAPVDLVE